MTHLMRVGDRLPRHDEGMDDARADGEPDQATMLGGVASRIDQKCTQHSIYSANHLQVILALASVPHPARRPKQTEGIYQEEDDAEDDKRSFEQHFAGGIVHLVSPIFAQSLHEGDKADPRSAGWQRCNLASAQLDHGPGVAVTRSPSNRNGVYFGARVRWLPQGNRLQRRSETVGYFRADQPGRYLAVSAPWARTKKV